MSNPNPINLNNLDGRYSKPADVASAIAAQATTDAGQYLPKWKPNTLYPTSTQLVNPTGQIVSASSSHTSGSTYDSSKWTQSVTASTTGGVDPTDVGYDVILVAGQSNAAEFGLGKDATFIDVPDPRIKQWAISGTYVNQVIAAVDSQLQFRIPTGDSTRIGFAMTFAREYIKTIPANRQVLLVPASQGGTGFTSTSISPAPSGYYLGTDGTNSGTWDPTNADGGYSLYQAAITKTNAAIAANPNSRLVAILWLQGEGDMGQLNQSQYSAKLDSLITGFRSTITGASQVPFLVGQTVPDWQYINQAINAALIDTPRRQQYTGFAYGLLNSASSGSDAVHYNAAGMRAMGRALFAAMSSAKVNIIGVAPLPPGIITINQDSSTQTTLHINWVRPLSHVTDYTIQYSTNAGSSWTALTRAQSIDNNTDITSISVGTAIMVRVATVNETGTSGYSTSNSYTTIYKTVSNTSTPSISGTATVGQVLTASTGTWSPTPDSYTYQWNRASTAIPGATNSTYTLDSPDAGQIITVTVTALKSGLTSGSAVSSGVVPGGAALPSSYKYRWKVGDLSALADGAVVSSWSSDSASATSSALTQGTAAKKPTVVTDSGKRYVRFDGTDDELAFAPAAATAQPVTIVFRARYRTMPTDPLGLYWSNGSGANVTSTYNGGLRLYAGSAQIQTPTGQITANTMFTASAVINGTSSAVQVGTNAKVTGSPGTLGISSGGARIGYAYGSSDNYAPIDICEIVIYDRALTDSELAQANTYLSATY